MSKVKCIMQNINFQSVIILLIAYYTIGLILFIYSYVSSIAFNTFIIYLYTIPSSEK